MGIYKKGHVIRVVLFDQILYNASLSKAFQLKNGHDVKLFLIELNMAGEGSEHVIGLVITR
jgi:hypothetical protein